MDQPETYDEQQTAEIFDLATRPWPDSAPPTSAGEARSFTLAELQEVGREVGISPDRVAAAAAEVAARAEVRQARSVLGMPRTVAREVPLARLPSDEEWASLVDELRDELGAHGRDMRHGTIREWTCRDVEARAEPAPSGARLRLDAERSSATDVTVTGAVAVAIGAGLLVTSGLDAATFGATLETLIPLAMSTFGAGVIGANVWRLRRWARARDEMFARISARVRDRAGS